MSWLQSPKSGSCGEHLQWELEDRTLHISGTGNMKDFDYGEYGYSDLPDWDTWIDYLILDQGITGIGDLAFENCYMSFVDIPEGVTRIGCEAFKHCDDLESVVLPATLTDLGYDAFTGCDSLRDIYFAGSREAWDLLDYSFDEDQQDTVTIHFGFTWPQWNEDGCGDVHWSLEEGVLTIRGSGSMPDFPVYDLAPWAEHWLEIGAVVIEPGVTSVGDRSFANLNCVTYVSFPEGLECIGSFAFAGCTDLLSAEIPGSVKRIGSHAFEECFSLQEVRFAEGLESIGSFAFSKCENLDSLSTPGSLRRIGSRAFENCKALEKLCFAAGLERIGDSAFAGCASLREVFFAGSEAEWGRIDFREGPWHDLLSKRPEEESPMPKIHFNCAGPVQEDGPQGRDA